MKTLIRALPYLFMALILLFIIILGFFFYLSYQSLPNYSKNLFSSDIESQIIIKTDLNAVPHITGNKDKEAFFGLGYVHAQERLWQMTYFKRLSQGRLSEINGPESVLLDSFMKSLDLQTLAKQMFLSLPEDLKKILSFYAQGVNFRLKEIDYIILQELFNYLGLSYEKNNLYWIRRNGIPNGRTSIKGGLQGNRI